jgi:mRNA-degrading endonuclease RelE of RelBE toxin-antitoxin system
MTSKASSSFWRCYEQLPENIRRLAEQKYQLWLENPQHPSLRFKPFRGEHWSVRIGDHYRAVSFWRDNETFAWTWIGTHED